ncbi:MAG: hypothetical protein FWD73_15145 [Polyangiaceae bacterium]|nr:hypothetical protein [Polyangiaceae bacterium]
MEPHIAPRRIGWRTTTAVDIRFRTVFHFVSACCCLANASRADLARAIGTGNADQSIGARRRFGPAAIDVGFIEVLHAIVVGSRQAHGRGVSIIWVVNICVANTASKGIAIVVAQTALALFAPWRNGTSAIDIGFITVLNAVVRGRGDARAFFAVLARTIGRFNAC